MAALVCAIVVFVEHTAHAQLSGQLGAHDPSTVVFDDGRYYYFSTGDLLAARSSSNLSSWTGEPSPFDAVPSWVTGAVPNYSGESLWAPDVIELNNQWYLYYSASIFGTRTSAIGYATSPTLDPDDPSYGWTDQGEVIRSVATSPYNAIDPSLLLDEGTGRLWMTWGSFNNGIYVKELDPSNGQPLDSSPGVNVAAPGPTVEIEGAAMVQRDGYYYMFVNWGGCCSGVDSTYNIRVGRSTSPTGPFLDQNGVNMLSGGGTLFLDDDGRKVGPGHFSFTDVGGQDLFSYHYYDGDFPWVDGMTGSPTFGLRELHWTSEGWPSIAEVAPNWTGQAGTSWSQATNWSTGVEPNGVGDVANFATPVLGQYNVSLPAERTVGTVNFRGTGSYMIGSAAGPTLTIDDIAGEESTVNVAEGSHTIAAPIVAADQMGVNVTPTNSTLSLGGGLTAPRLSKYGSGELVLGGTNTVAGSVFVRRGELRLTGSLTAGSFSSVGQIVGETAVMTVSGSGSFTTSFDLNIGDTGDGVNPATGTLNIEDNATLLVDQGGLFVGSGFFGGTLAEGTVNQSGGTLTVNNASSGAFTIGGRNSANATGAYNLSGGVVNANTDLYVGGEGAGVLEQTGGVLNANDDLSLGRFAGSTGAYTIGGGTFSSGQTVYVGHAGSGELTLQNTGQVNITGALTLGQEASSNGVLNLRGGTLSTRSVSSGAGSTTINFDGGTVRATASSTAFLQADNAYVQAGGARINTQFFGGSSIQVHTPLQHDPALGAARDGGLTKIGSGTLTLTSASTFTGETNVEGGVLALSGGASIAGSDTIRVHPGATLNVSGLTGSFTLASGQTLENNSNSTVVGDVVATSGSTLTGSGSYADSVTIESGSVFAAGGTGAPLAPSLVVTNGDFETGIFPPGDADVDLWYDVNTFAGASDFWNTAQHEQGLSPTPDTGVLLGDGNGAIGGPNGAGGRWIYQQLGVKNADANYAISFDYGGDNAAAPNRAVAVRAEVYQGAFPGAADDNDIADEGLTLVATLDAPPTALFGEGNFASFVSPLDLSAANATDPLWLRLSNLPGAGSDPGAWVVIDNVAIQSSGFTAGFSATTVQDNLVFASGSTASFDIAESGVHDQIVVGGDLTVSDGFVLELLLDPTVMASSLVEGNSWNLFDFANASGLFDQSDFLLPTLSSGLSWDTSNLLTTGVIAIVANLLPGDANGDGAVDILDLDILSGNFGTMGGATLAQGDFNGDGNVDILDLDILSGNFGSMNSDAATIPEPAGLVATIVLTAVGLSMQAPREHSRN